MKFVSKEEFNKLQSNENTEELLNEILSRVFNAAVETAITKLPDVVARMAKSTVAIQNMTKEFFESNEDFKDHKDVVAGVVQDIESRHADWDYGKILETAKPLIKEKLAIDIPDLPTDTPTEVNLNGNGVI